MAHGDREFLQTCTQGRAQSLGAEVNAMATLRILQHFKAKAGDRGYQTLINEALKQAMQAEASEGVVRKTIREELRRP
jgi:uncharacterized protein (DUF4415 family)